MEQLEGTAPLAMFENLLGFKFENFGLMQHAWSIPHWGL